MTSPPASPLVPAYGSSCSTGGHSRGHALGNVFNLADAADDGPETLVSRTGKVLLYNSPVDPTAVKPFRTLKVNVQFSMAPILKSIAAKWSPIESMGFDA